MPSGPDLRLDWCDRKAAEFACRRWHYSGTLPSGKIVTVGVWEAGRFIGCVAFSRGANNSIGRPYNLSQTQVCELVRVALTRHATPVSRIIRVAVLFLRGLCPTLRLVVSYADPARGHHGGVYQAGGWLYAGPSEARMPFVVDGKAMHRRSVSAKYGTLRLGDLAALGLTVTRGERAFKHTYLLPLDNGMRRQIAGLSKPYPKRVKQANPGDQPGSGGAAPTHTLHNTHPSNRPD